MLGAYQRRWQAQQIGTVMGNKDEKGVMAPFSLQICRQVLLWQLNIQWVPNLSTRDPK